MYCDNCGAELVDGASFCSSCGKKVRVKKPRKNIYIALVLTFLLTGLGTIYAGNTMKGLKLLALRILFISLGVFLNFFFIFSFIVWAYAFYEAYKDVQIANGHSNPNIINDFKGWNPNTQKVALIIIAVILILMVIGCISSLTLNSYSSSDSKSHYYSSGSGSSSGSSHSTHSSHYSGVDDSPHTIARNDPDWYYDHYEYGDNPDIDDYLESQGYD